MRVGEHLAQCSYTKVEKNPRPLDRVFDDAAIMPPRRIIINVLNLLSAEALRDARNVNYTYRRILCMLRPYRPL